MNSKIARYYFFYDVCIDFVELTGCKLKIRYET